MSDSVARIKDPGTLSSQVGYADWAFKMKGAFMFLSLWTLVSTAPPTTPDQVWLDKDEKARGFLMMHVAQGLQDHFNQLVLDPATGIVTTTIANTANAQWTNLNNSFSTGEPLTVFNNFRALFHGKFTETEKMDKQLNALSTRIQDVEASGMKLTEQQKAFIHIFHLPDSYSSVESMLLVTGTLNQLTVATVVAKILAFEASPSNWQHQGPGEAHLQRQAPRQGEMLSLPQVRTQ